MVCLSIITFVAYTFWAQCILAHAIDLGHLGLQAEKRADSSLVGYLGAFFLGADPFVYFYLSNGNNPTSFKALNGGKPVLKPTLGTKGIRDPFVVQGGGNEAGKKWYIIGTDLDIGKTTWDASVRKGSRGIFVWDSTDLVNWGNERLVVVEDTTAGMVWAPEAIWDAAKSQYLVHWASRFYSASDTGHTGSSTVNMIRYAYTSDFKTFTKPQTYIDKTPTSVIDLDIVSLDSTGTNYLRFIKDEDIKTVFMESSTSGLFGTWTRAGGNSGVITKNVEGPAGYRDNLIENKVHVLLDFYGGNGYAPYESTDAKANSWKASDATKFPTLLRHGSVLPINQSLYDALNKKWGQ